MQLWKRVFFILLGLILLLGAIGFFLPSHYQVQRSLEMRAPPEKIFLQVDTPKEWKRWAVWNQRDPNMRITYSGPESGVGARWDWVSQTEGSGNMTFTAVESNKKLSYHLEFPEFQSVSTGTIVLEPIDAAVTRVTWTNEGDLGSNPIKRYFGLLMDSMIGKDFAAGLQNLKLLVEKP